uniref:RING-type domain-containing protein n=1 Tax=Noccaea caerulescens TaxID=107243 RepID=A0A1J3K6E6_NOCCA
MGNACCVASRDKMVMPNAPAVESLQRNNVRYSPNWSFRWDNRGRVAGEETSLSWLSDGISRNDGSDVKSESAFVSSQGSPLDNFQTQSWHKSPASDQSFSRVASIDTISEHPAAYRSPAKRSLSLTSQPSSLSASPLSSQSHLPMPPGSSSTLKLTPRPRLSKQVSDGQILGFTSPSRSSATQERLGNESHSGPSDGWSMQAFSEMMAYSRRESCSYDNECLGLRRDKLDHHQGNPKSNAQQTCGACSRSLSGVSLLSSQKIFATNELSIAAILACGHVYHSECLEHMTPEADKFDPPCPICTLGEKKTLKLSEKAFRADLDLKAKHNKRLRSRVVDSDDFVMFDHSHKGGGGGGGTSHKGKVPKLVTSLSLRSYSPKPFLARHFSFGSRSNSVKSPKESHSAISLRKKGFFWTKSSKL